MIQIGEPPDIHACASCQRPLRWFWSFYAQRLFSAIVDDQNPKTLHLHECPPPLQEAATWRDLQRRPGAQQARINAAGRQAVEEAIQERTEES